MPWKFCDFEANTSTKRIEKEKIIWGRPPPFLGFSILPRSLTWNLKISPWKRRFLLETIIFRFHVKFPGYILFFQCCICIVMLMSATYANITWDNLGEIDWEAIAWPNSTEDTLGVETWQFLKLEWTEKVVKRRTGFLLSTNISGLPPALLEWKNTLLHVRV